MNMVWVCCMCSTSNDDSKEICTVCDAQRIRTRTFDDIAEKNKAKIDERNKYYSWGVTMLSQRKYAEAFQAFKASADLGHAAGMDETAKMYFAGRGTPQNPKAGFVEGGLYAFGVQSRQLLSPRKGYGGKSRSCDRVPEKGFGQVLSACTA